MCVQGWAPPGEEAPRTQEPASPPSSKGLGARLAEGCGLVPGSPGSVSRRSPVLSSPGHSCSARFPSPPRGPVRDRPARPWCPSAALSSAAHIRAERESETAEGGAGTSTLHHCPVLCPAQTSAASLAPTNGLRQDAFSQVQLRHDPLCDKSSFSSCASCWELCSRAGRPPQVPSGPFPDAVWCFILLAEHR